MNTSYNSHQVGSLQARYGLRVAARLSAGLDDVPHDVAERLRVARITQSARFKRAHGATRLTESNGKQCLTAKK